MNTIIAFRNAKTRDEGFAFKVEGRFYRCYLVRRHFLSYAFKYILDSKYTHGNNTENYFGSTFRITDNRQTLIKVYGSSQF